MTREEAVECLKGKDCGDCKYYDSPQDECVKVFNMAIEALERKRGKWIYEPNEYWYRCSCCGDTRYDGDNYCPNCGADMRREQAETKKGCRVCGEAVALSYNFCPNCGADMKGEGK